MSTFCSSDIQALAIATHQGLNSPTSMSVGFISGVYSSSTFLGELNNRLSTNFSITGSCIAGGFGPSEAAIYSAMFEARWFKQESLRVLQGAGSAGSWTSLGDGDGRVTRESSTKLASEYRHLAKNLDEDLAVMTAQWIRGHSLAVSVDAAPCASYPSP